MLSPQLIEQGHCQINNNLIFRRRFRTSASDDGFASLRQLHPDGDHHNWYDDYTI